MDDNNFTSYSSNINKRRHTLPSTSFVDPAIVRFIEKASLSTASSVMVDEDMDDQRTTISSISLPQQLDYHPHKPTTNNLDYLWSRQEKYDNLELRLLALEATKKRFEHRLQVLEDNNNRPILLQHQQPVKPDQQQPTTTTTTTGKRILHEGNMIQQHDNQLTDLQTTTHDEEMMVTKQQYLSLLDKHQSLLQKYNSIQSEYKEKEKYYKQRILLLEEQQQQQQVKDNNQPVEEEASYKEEDGYLIFDTTNMNGEIIHCKVKIPTPSMALASPPATRVGSPQYQTPPTPFPTSTIPSSKKKGLNYNAPEWKTNHF